MGKRRNLIQYAAMPFRQGQGEPEVMLVTSRETKRWILPKGNPKKNTKSYMVAAEEAFEEAGLKGRASQKPFYTFDSIKRLKSGKQVPCRVRVFSLAVKKQAERWPEKGERERAWMSFAEAAHNAGEAGLVLLFLELAADPEGALARLKPLGLAAKGKSKPKSKAKAKGKLKPKDPLKKIKAKAKTKKKPKPAPSAKPKAKAKAKPKTKTKNGAA
ncbi:MAG: NUDIX domain-containing protein [Rhodospirillales bacterium]|nr:NUDIX domain-containing protein [Rhodospirillales bacterium]